MTLTVLHYYRMKANFLPPELHPHSAFTSGRQNWRSM